MHWFILILAGLLEIGWAIGLKYTDGFTRLAFAMKALPVGTAYAVWVGIGAIGTAIFGIFLFGESTDPLKLLSLSLIFIGIIGLKLAHT